ncbi:MAG: hypothetical protein WB792_12570, partial [Desulfobacterales bacterium]
IGTGAGGRALDITATMMGASSMKISGVKKERSMSISGEKKGGSMEKEAATGTERFDRRYLQRTFDDG